MVRLQAGEIQWDFVIHVYLDNEEDLYYSRDDDEEIDPRTSH